jgi:rubrerythrin
MTDHALDADMTCEQILAEVMAAERETQLLLENAARLAPDAEERALFERLARRERDALRELEREQQRLDAERFVQRALDC